MAIRIGYITYGLDRTPAGIGRYTFELLKALASLPESPEIVLLTTEREDLYGIWKQFEHHPLPGCRLLPSLLTFGNMAVSIAGKSYHLDIIHDPTGTAPFLGPQLGTRRVVTIHDAFAYVHPETHNQLDNWRYHWMLPYAARRADEILTISHCSRRDLTRYMDLPNERINVTYLGVDPRFRPDLPSDELENVLSRYRIQQPFLLFVGGINARKNVSRILEAYVRVRERNPGISFVVIGKRQWQTSGIDETLKRLNLDSHVQFTGYVPDTDLPALYHTAEMFLFPSLYEGFGLPLLEAMACGTPVITSNISSLPEVAGNAALSVNPLDVNELTSAIELLLTDMALKDCLRQRGLEQARRFTWEKTAHETVAVYMKMLSEN